MAAAIAAGGEKKKLTLAREEKAPEDEDILVVDFAEAKKEMKTPWIIVGRYNSKRIFNTAGLFVRMRHLWQLHGGMEEKGIGEKRFVIVLEREGDYNHILKGGPWTYMNDAFLVAKYDGISSAMEVPVNVMPIWTRVLDLPMAMMTQEWAEKIGKQFLGPVREVGKDNRGHVWASFLRIRVEHNVEMPIKRWIPIAGKEGSKPRRFEVKYEGAPHFCFFCGIFGHNERNCLLPEEEKIVSEEQCASPYRHAENRSYYVPVEEKKTKRSLYFPPISSGWKLSPESGDLGDMSACNQIVGAQAVEDQVEEEGQAIPDPIQEVLATAVTNLNVNDALAPTDVTTEQVSKAAKAFKAKMYGSGKYKLKGGNKIASTNRAGGQLAQEARGNNGETRDFAVPNILDCLREDGSLYEELRGGAVHTASAFLKKKKRVLGKRQAPEDTSTEEGSQSFVIRFRGDGEKKSRGSEVISQEVLQDGDGVEEDMEATSQGAAGQLTGAKDRACQEP
jgi:hypothetical protein